MWNCIASRCPVPIHGPSAEAAKLRGIVYGHDAVAANLCYFHHLVNTTRRDPAPDGSIPPEVLVISVPCKQHGASNSMQPMTVFSNIINPAFCTSRVLSSGPIAAHCRANFKTALLNDLEFVDAATWGGCEEGMRYSTALLEMCCCNTDLFYREEAAADFVLAEEKHRRRRGALLQEVRPAEWRGTISIASPTLN